MALYLDIADRLVELVLENRSSCDSTGRQADERLHEAIMQIPLSCASAASGQ